MEDDLEGFLGQLLAHAQGDEGQLKVLEQAFQSSLRFPLPARVVGVSVQVTSIVYEGDARRGLVAICWREGEQHRVSVATRSWPRHR